MAFISALADIIEYVEGNEVKIFTDYVQGITPEDQHSFACFTLIDITRQAKTVNYRNVLKCYI